MSGNYRNLVVDIVSPLGTRTLSLSFPAEIVTDDDIDDGQVRIMVKGLTRAMKLPSDCSFDTAPDGPLVTNAERRQ